MSLKGDLPRKGAGGLTRFGVLIALVVGAVLTGSSSQTAYGSSSATPPNPPTLTINKGVSSIWIGESWNRVEYQWGYKNETGCMLMDENLKRCAAQGFIMKYNVSGGYIRVGVYKRRVVYIETTSTAYKTPDGIGIGSAIPYGKKTVLGETTFRYYAESGSWQGWTKLIRYPKKAKYFPKPNRLYRRWVAAVSHQRLTLLFMNKGVVTDIWIVRGDVNLQL